VERDSIANIKAMRSCVAGRSATIADHIRSADLLFPPPTDQLIALARADLLFVADSRRHSAIKTSMHFSNKNIN
jgi:hypothetical protein